MLARSLLSAFIFLISSDDCICSTMLAGTYISNQCCYHHHSLGYGRSVLQHWVHPKKALGEVDWGVFLMIAAALGFSDAITYSGVAGSFGKAIREADVSPHSA
jgi:hypothetical protein